MKSTVATVLIASLVSQSAVGCATARGPRQLDDSPFASGPQIPSWSRVAELAPGAAMTVTVKGSHPAPRYFVTADESALVALNLSNTSLPAASIRVLRDMAAHHPEYFAAMRTARSFAQDNVRVGRDGVVVDNRKVADLEQVVETISRNDVIEVTGPVLARGSVPGVILGGWLGFAVGVTPGLGGVSAGAAWLLLFASVAAGASLGFHWSTHSTEGVVYHAP